MLHELLVPQGRRGERQGRVPLRENPGLFARINASDYAELVQAMPVPAG